MQTLEQCNADWFQQEFNDIVAVVDGNIPEPMLAAMIIVAMPRIEMTVLLTKFSKWCFKLVFGMIGSLETFSKWERISVVFVK